MHEVRGRGRAGWGRHGGRPPGLGALPGPCAEVVALLRELAVLELGAGSAAGLAVEDLAQEACLRLLRGVAPPGGWEGRGLHAWAGWLRLLVRNLAQGHRAREQRRRATTYGGWGAHPGPGAATQDGGLERVDEALDPPLGLLPKVLRPAATLMLAGLSATEAARALSLAEAELRRRALLAAWVLAEGEPPTLDPAGAIPRRASLRGAIFRAILRRRREGWSWPQLAAVLGCGAEELRRRAERHFEQNP